MPNTTPSTNTPSSAATSAPSTAAVGAGALSHLKVLDLSRVLAGPWCTQMLADLGADVCKIERPGSGDDTRHWGPPFMPGPDGQPSADATYFTTCNRNKRSVTIDIAQPEGQALVRQMALRSDILVENFKVGGLAHYGLDYASLHALNPRLIYCSITGFGQDGPYAERAGYDLMIQAMSGMMSITGQPDGTPGGGPQRAGVAITDVFTGIYATSAVLAALEMRHRTGLGQHIDMALLDVGMAVLANQAAGYLNTGIEPQRQGNTHPSLVPYQDLPTADGAMLLAIGNDGQFARFCQAAGQPGWASDPRFATNTLRVQHRNTLVPLLCEVTRQRSTADWVALLEHQAVPCGPINTLARAFADPQVQARGLVLKQPLTPASIAQGAIKTGANIAPDAPAAPPPAAAPIATIGSVATVASPLRLSDAPVQLRYPPPALGEHTDAVLAELGLDAQAIAALRGKGVV